MQSEPRTALTGPSCPLSTYSFSTAIIAAARECTALIIATNASRVFWSPVSSGWVWYFWSTSSSRSSPSFRRLWLNRLGSSWYVFAATMEFWFPLTSCWQKLSLRLERKKQQALWNWTKMALAWAPWKQCRRRWIQAVRPRRFVIVILIIIPTCKCMHPVWYTYKTNNTNTYQAHTVQTSRRISVNKELFKNCSFLCIRTYTGAVVADRCAPLNRKPFCPSSLLMNDPQSLIIQRSPDIISNNSIDSAHRPWPSWFFNILIK